MNRGAWWATVQTVADRVGHDLVTKQQQRECSPRSSSPGYHHHCLVTVVLVWAFYCNLDQLRGVKSSYKWAASSG